MTIYTRGGDRGTTSLFSGERVAKNDIRIEAYGAVDELNSVLGTVVAALPADGDLLRSDLLRIQAELFQVGAWLATTAASTAQSVLAPFTDEPTRRLETAIDRLDAELPKLTSFLLPGGHLSAALAQLARTTCRRAERRVIGLLQHMEEMEREPLEPVLIYLNRLSDYLFVAARYCNRIAGIDEHLWTQG